MRWWYGESLGDGEGGYKENEGGLGREGAVLSWLEGRPWWIRGSMHAAPGEGTRMAVLAE